MPKMRSHSGTKKRLTITASGKVRRGQAGNRHLAPGKTQKQTRQTRNKGGVVSRRRRNRVLKQAKGFFGSKHCLYKVANQQVMKSLVYAYRDRKNNKRNFRKLWIVRINAASRALGLSYNQLMHGLKLANVDINRKMLADLAVNDAAMFENLCTTAKNALAK